MVFTGLMNYYPNSHGITFFLDRIFPLILESVPDARVYIVGANPSRRLRALASVNVAVVGHVKDVRPYIARGEISIIPLLIGGGTRLKVLEAMAMRKPIVSTTLGCEGLDIVDGQSAVFADTPQEFAAAVVRLFSDRGLRERLAAKAYEKASDYRWESIGTALEGVYQSLLSARQPSHV
jgi:glycosyltransferase involved in cell wall biosynthesis